MSNLNNEVNLRLRLRERRQLVAAVIQHGIKRLAEAPLDEPPAVVSSAISATVLEIGRGQAVDDWFQLLDDKLKSIREQLKNNPDLPRDMQWVWTSNKETK